MTVEGVDLRPARASDVPAIWALILELAEYERLSEAVDGSAEALADHLFGPSPRVEAWVAEAEGTLVGYTLFFSTYSTFRTRPGIWMEDLYVTPAWRGRGIGLALFHQVRRLANERGCARMEWSVLDWNSPAINFYARQGAILLPDWRICRLDGDALESRS